MGYPILPPGSCAVGRIVHSLVLVCGVRCRSGAGRAQPTCHKVYKARLRDGPGRAPRRHQDRAAHPLARAGSAEACHGAVLAPGYGEGVPRRPHVGTALHLLLRRPRESGTARIAHSRHALHLGVAGRDERCGADTVARLLEAPQGPHHRYDTPTWTTAPCATPPVPDEAAGGGYGDTPETPPGIREPSATVAAPALNGQETPRVAPGVPLFGVIADALPA